MSSEWHLVHTTYETILLRYVTYNQWANDRLLSFVSENFKPEQLEQSIVSSFPSVDDFVAPVGRGMHLADAPEGRIPDYLKWMEFSGSFRNCTVRSSRTTKPGSISSKPAGMHFTDPIPVQVAGRYGVSQHGRRSRAVLYEPQHLSSWSVDHIVPAVGF